MDVILWFLFGFSALLVSEAYQPYSSSVTSLYYSKKPLSLCDVQQRSDTKCMVLATIWKIGVIECVRMCNEQSSKCRSAVMNDEGNCYFDKCRGNNSNNTNPVYKKCGLGDTVYHEYTPKPFKCHNGGILRGGSTNICDCVKPWTGCRCDRRPSSCREIRQLGYPKGTHWVIMNFLGNPRTSKVKCKITQFYVYTYFSYNDGTSCNYNSTFQEYKYGFYKNQTCFWLGLDNMRAITQTGFHQAVLEVKINGTIKKSSLINFVIHGEDQKYGVSYDDIDQERDTNPEIGACIEKGAQFSAWDQDNDAEKDLNLAAVAGSGWWFVTKNVSYCNFNGKKPVESTKGRPNDMPLDYIHMDGKDFGYSQWYLAEFD